MNILDYIKQNWIAILAVAVASISLAVDIFFRGKSRKKELDDRALQIAEKRKELMELITKDSFFIEDILELALSLQARRENYIKNVKENFNKPEYITKDSAQIIADFVSKKDEIVKRLEAIAKYLNEIKSSFIDKENVSPAELEEVIGIVNSTHHVLEKYNKHLSNMEKASEKEFSQISEILKLSKESKNLISINGKLHKRTSILHSGLEIFNRERQILEDDVNSKQDESETLDIDIGETINTMENLMDWANLPEVQEMLKEEPELKERLDSLINRWENLNINIQEDESNTPQN